MSTGYDIPFEKTTLLPPKNSPSFIPEDILMPDWSNKDLRETTRSLDLNDIDDEWGQHHSVPNTPMSPEKQEMMRTTHNDPELKEVVDQDLHGSTQILYNARCSRSEMENTRRSSANSMNTPKSPMLQRFHDSFSTLLLRNPNSGKNSTVLFLEKIKHSFFEDAKNLAAGTIPQSIVLAITIGTVCGIACWLYYTVLFFLLDFLWGKLPETVVEGHWEEKYYWLWTPIVSLTMCIFVGLAVVFLGEPGDLPYTISRVHHDAYIPMDHVTPMVFASMFSILAGGSLGPEAPLVAICGALGGFVSRKIFRQKYVNVVRKHTLMGMAGALAAFFGAPLGGSLFALEVNSRFGIEYFEHLVESIFCGEICLVVFRSLSGMSIKPIWDLTEEGGRLLEIEPWLVIAGGLIGLAGAFMAYIFALFHWKNMELFSYLNLLDNKRAVYRALFGGIFIVVIGVFVPQTMFWGEEEFQVVATMDEAKELPNIWPTSGRSGFEMNSSWKAFVVGMCKIVSISFTVAGGLRGGFIFPLMCAGAAFGRVIHDVTPDFIPLQVSVLCMAAGMNVAITRTSMATTLILAFLSGEPCAIPPILMASLCSLFATSYMPFIKTQITRSDIDHSLYHQEHHVKAGDAFPDED